MSADLEPYAKPVDGHVICGHIAAHCRCISAPHADGPHACQCGGVWEYRDNGSLVMLTPPGNLSPASLLRAMGMAWRDDDEDE